MICDLCEGYGGDEEINNLHKTFSEWCHFLSQEEVDYLVDSHRLWDLTMNFDESAKKYKYKDEEYLDDIKDNYNDLYRQIILRDSCEDKFIEAQLMDAIEKKKKKLGIKFYPQASDVNEWSYSYRGHDAYNKYLLIEFRVKKYNLLDSKCTKCGGHGEID